MARIAWRFEDPTESTIEYMEINPNEGASPAYSKSLLKETTTAPGGVGRTLVYEGADQPTMLSFSGAILTENQYNFLLTAYLKRHPVRLTDDLGRTFTIYFETFTPQRVRSAQYPWRHTYEASVVIL